MHFHVDLPQGMVRLGYVVGEEVVMTGSGGGGGGKVARDGRPNQRGEGASASLHENNGKVKKKDYHFFHK